ncbi:MAG: helix-turn-helix domain-containing protein [Phycisphaerales bacterium]|nr:MAG: helix-turn-helix domain-containing protein [Phycisphaerales bacterium]
MTAQRVKTTQGTRTRFRWLDAVLAANLRSRAKVVAAYLFARSNGECLAWPSQPTLAEGCNMSRRGVQLGLDELEEAGFLTTDLHAGPVCSDKRNRPNVYKLQAAHDCARLNGKQGAHAGARPKRARGAQNDAQGAHDRAHGTLIEHSVNEPKKVRASQSVASSSKEGLKPSEMKTALCDIFGLDETKLSKPEHGRYMKAAKEYLKTPRAFPTEIRRRRERYRRMWPKVTCSPEAVLKHWSELNGDECNGKHAEAGRIRGKAGTFAAITPIRTASA